MTPRKALARVLEVCDNEDAALLQHVADSGRPEYWAGGIINQLREILEQVQPEQGVTLTAEDAFFVAAVFWAHIADANLSERTVARMQTLAERLGGDA